MRYIISTIFCFIALVCYSQKTDSAKWEPKPRGYRIGVDVLGLTKSAVLPGRIITEFNGEIDTKKYIFALDAGAYKNSIDSLPRFKYDISGNFFRLGVDANIIHRDADKSVVSVGARYGFATFKDQLQYTLEDPVFGTFSDLTANNSRLSARWFELNFGMRAHVWKMIWMGYQARFKFGLKTDSDAFIPYEVPGYGPTETNTDKNSYWGFNYYIQIGINAKDKK